eukprot:2001951-Prymnesium_polylepis.1
MGSVKRSYDRFTPCRPALQNASCALPRAFAALSAVGPIQPPCTPGWLFGTALTLPSRWACG